MYKEKYLKYKTKYLDLKSQLGGAPTDGQHPSYLLKNLNVVKNFVMRRPNAPAPPASATQAPVASVPVASVPVASEHDSPAPPASTTQAPQDTLPTTTDVIDFFQNEIIKGESLFKVNKVIVMRDSLIKKKVKDLIDALYNFRHKQNTLFDNELIEKEKTFLDLNKTFLSEYRLTLPNPLPLPVKISPSESLPDSYKFGENN